MIQTGQCSAAICTAHDDSLICINIILAVSPEPGTVGFLGELTLGHAGFMSVGAYSGCLFAIYTQEVGMRHCAIPLPDLRHAGGRPGGRTVRHHHRRSRRCDCRATTWPSSRWPSAKSFASVIANS